LTPFWILYYCISEFFLDLKHALSELKLTNLDLASLNVRLDLVVGQLSQCLLKVLIKLLSKSLSTCFVVWYDSVLNKIIFILFVFNFDAVKLFLDISLQGLESFEDLLICIDELDLLKWVFHGDFDLISDKPSSLDGILHPLNHSFSFLINERVTMQRHGSEMDTFSLLR